MEFKSRFRPGQKGYYINNNKIYCREIKCIILDSDRSDNEIYFDNCEWRHEKFVYGSIERALKSFREEKITPNSEPFTVNTEFSIDDVVSFIYDNFICCGIIKSAQIILRKDEEPEINYAIEIDDGLVKTFSQKSIWSDPKEVRVEIVRDGKSTFRKIY